MKIDGRCHCGYVSFEAEADPETTTMCNCTDCQTMSGAPMRAVISTRPGTFVLLSGKPKEYLKTADSRAVRPQAFCPQCGTAIYSTSVGDDPNLTTSGSGYYANAMNYCRADSYLFNRSRRGSTTSLRCKNLIRCRRRVEDCSQPAAASGTFRTSRDVRVESASLRA